MRRIVILIFEVILWAFVAVWLYGTLRWLLAPMPGALS